MTAMRRFTVYRRGDLSATHNENQANHAADAQFEGVVFSDGTVAIRWLTLLRSTAVWEDFATMAGVHGHPEERYGSELVWHDSDIALDLLRAETPLPEPVNGAEVELLNFACRIGGLTASESSPDYVHLCTLVEWVRREAMEGMIPDPLWST